MTVVEGSSDTYTVKLDTEPSADVTITVAGHADTEVTVSPATLTFTEDDWNMAQTVTVSLGGDDAVDDPAVTLAHDVSGGGYDDITADDVTVNLSDDDEADVSLSKTSLTVNEGGAGDYTVKLEAQPSASVAVTISPGTGVTTDKSELTFTTTN